MQNLINSFAGGIQEPLKAAGSSAETASKTSREIRAKTRSYLVLKPGLKLGHNLG